MLVVDNLKGPRFFLIIFPTRKNSKLENCNVPSLRGWQTIWKKNFLKIKRDQAALHLKFCRRIILKFFVFSKYFDWRILPKKIFLFFSFFDLWGYCCSTSNKQIFWLDFFVWASMYWKLTLLLFFPWRVNIKFANFYGLIGSFWKHAYWRFLNNKSHHFEKKISTTFFIYQSRKRKLESWSFIWKSSRMEPIYFFKNSKIVFLVRKIIKD